MEKSVFEQMGGTYHREGITEDLKAADQMALVGLQLTTIACYP